jgi:hypothetical protein
MLNMKTSVALIGLCLVAGAVLFAAPAATAINVVGTCSFASATVNGVAYFCSNLGQPGCTSLTVAANTVSWCN